METPKTQMRYGFGKNWQRFLDSLDKERIESAQASLTEFIKLDDLRSKSFLDIGCGSGLFSYAAFNLGASPIVSFDYDPFSVECCRYLYQKVSQPANWKIFQGSILDQDLTQKLGQFDVVYSWGVLHHTGDMWQAITNAASLVKKEGGLFYFAIYHKKGGLLGADFWLQIKKLYNSVPKILQYVLEFFYLIAFFIAELLKLKNPVKTLKEHRANRGMDWQTDMRDWLGGYPYEFATVEEIIEFMKKNFADYRLINIKRTEYVMGLNWFLFSRS